MSGQLHLRHGAPTQGIGDHFAVGFVYNRRHRGSRMQARDTVDGGDLMINRVRRSLVGEFAEPDSGGVAVGLVG